jgi:hypothetical protein
MYPLDTRFLERLITFPLESTVAYKAVLEGRERLGINQNFVSLWSWRNGFGYGLG